MRLEKPFRAAHTYVQHLKASPEAVFPLLCPVGETRWIEGWDPLVVYSESGVAEPECVFVTEDGGSEAVWVVTAYEPPRRIAFVKFVPGFAVTQLQIDLDAVGAEAQARVTYGYTALSKEGQAYVAGQTAAAYERFMQTWEARLNHYLQTGEKLAVESSAV